MFIKNQIKCPKPDRVINHVTVFDMSLNADVFETKGCSVY